MLLRWSLLTVRCGHMDIFYTYLYILYWWNITICLFCKLFFFIFHYLQKDLLSALGALGENSSLPLSDSGVCWSSLGLLVSGYVFLWPSPLPSVSAVLLFPIIPVTGFRAHLDNPGGSLKILNYICNNPSPK